MQRRGDDTVIMMMMAMTTTTKATLLFVVFVAVAAAVVAMRFSPREAHELGAIRSRNRASCRKRPSGGSEDASTWLYLKVPGDIACSVRLRDAACSDAGLLPPATVGHGFEMVAQKAASVLCGRCGWKGAT